MWKLTRLVLKSSDSLNHGSSMTLGSKGSRLSTDAHRQRMPWMVAKEYVPGVVLNARDKTILDGSQLIDVDQIDRSSQADPLEVLKAAVASYHFNTSTGKNIFQLVSQTPFHGRGQKLYRKEWQEGTYEKSVTLSAVDFARDGNTGVAYGYVTFHGESTTRPVRIDHAGVPGWVMSFEASRAVPFDEVVAPPPSIGTDVPVTPSEYRLKAYPYYDAPNPPEFVERLLKDRGVLPDLPAEASAEGDVVGDGSAADGSEHVSGAVSK